jgi:arylsulfatase A-like enzyme
MRERNAQGSPGRAGFLATCVGALLLAVLLVPLPSGRMTGVGSPEGPRGGPGGSPQGPAAAAGHQASAQPVRAEDSLLDRAEAGEVDGRRYIALDGKTGQWALAVAGEARSIVTARGSGPPILGHERTKLALDAGLVHGACLSIILDAKRPGQVSWRDSTQAQGKASFPAGESTVHLHCVPDDTAGQLFRLSLWMEEGSSGTGLSAPMVRGLWLVPGKKPPPQGPARIEACPSGDGVMLKPGSRLFFTTVGFAGRKLRLAAGGSGAPSLGAVLRFDGREPVVLPVTVDRAGGRVEASWVFPQAQGAQPVQVEVTLPADAGGEACLRRLSVVYDKPPPLLEKKPPRIDGVVFVLVDTLRADSLPFIDPGAGVELPALGKLASESVVFSMATAPSHYTKASMGSVFTGLNPFAHGALTIPAALRPSVPLITELLAKAGVDTQGFFSNTFLNNRKFGFAKGWRYLASVNCFKACVGGEAVLEKLAAWASSWKPDGPYFVYIHLMDPHAPYSPPPALELEYLGFNVKSGRFLPLHTAEFLRKVRSGEERPPDKGELAVLKGLYRADVAQADAMLASVLQILEAKGILDRSLVILASDHGEEFMEHGMLGHGTNLYDELVHVPVMMRWPGGAVTGKVGSRVGLIDLPPTILEAFGVPQPAGMKQGRSLLGLLGGGRTDWKKRAYLVEHKNGTEKGVIVGDLQLIAGKGGLELLRGSEHAREHLAVADHPIAVRFLKGRMAELLSGGSPDVESAALDLELSEEEIEKLRTLGYVL